MYLVMSLYKLLYSFATVLPKEYFAIASLALSIVI